MNRVLFVKNCTKVK